MFKVKIKEPERYFELDVHSKNYDDLPVVIESPDEEDLMRTTAIRSKAKRLAWAMYLDFRVKMRIYNRAILHNLANTQLQIKQTVERYTRKIDRGLSYPDRIKAFAALIAKDPDSFAEDLIFIEQRAVDLDAQLLGINLLVGKEYEVDLSQSHSLQGLILRCAYPFLDSLHENGVGISFKEMESVNITTDFRLFNCAIYHFFDNVKKYIRSDSTILVSMAENDTHLRFEMTSRALEDGEDVKVFNEGYSGRNAKEQGGEGFGMFIYKLVLDKLNATPGISWDESSRRMVGEIPYQQNTFIIKFPQNIVNRVA